MLHHRVLQKLRHKVAQVVGQGQGSSAAGLPCRYAVDSPVERKQASKTVAIQGWLVPTKGTVVQGLRVRIGDQTYEVSYGLPRPDVAKALPDVSQDLAAKSGFSTDVTIGSGVVVLEVDLGSGYQKLHEIEVEYAPEKTVADYYNPHLAERYAEHQNLLDNKKAYWYEELSTKPYVRSKQDPRLVAFYLPQFHPLKANDVRFGKGFTEWTNVTAAQPRFVGHQQPVLPRDFGFYDLRMDSVIEEQIAMAKHHGIYGFCFYYYWFSGNRVLERPLESFLQHKEWDFNFMICWANENWTKSWDGSNRDIFIEQEYLPEDPLKFIKDVEPILTDPRYMKENGKPILGVYRPLDLKEPKRYVQVWRDYFRKHHHTELHLVSVMSFDDHDPRTFGFDAAIDFPPQTTFFKNHIFKDGKYPYLDVSDKLLDNSFHGSVADYRQLALNPKLYDTFDFPTYKSVIPAWDNDPRQNRRNNHGYVAHYANPDLYAHWLDAVLQKETKDKPDPLVFVNAWNEWGEGAVLEPSQHQGRTVLNRTTEVLSAYSGNKRNGSNNPRWGIQKRDKVETAVVIHLYYPETWDFLQQQLRQLGKLPYDLHVTLTIKDADLAAEITAFDSNAQVYIVPNRGRDVLPFMHVARRLAHSGYKYVLKLHGKRSTWRSDGADWFESVVGNLLPNPEVVRSIVQTLGKERTVVGPQGHFVNLERYMGSNEMHLRQLLAQVYDEKTADKTVKQAARHGYFAGTMFWAHIEALKPLLDLYMMPEDFPPEQGQIDGAVGHVVERALSVVPQLGGRTLYQVSAKGVRAVKSADSEQNYRFAP